MIAQKELETIARTAATAHGLDLARVCAGCDHESIGWQQYAVRYEPGFYDRYVSAMHGLTETEKKMRATSFGLMQVLGQTARELGFDGRFLTELFEPETAIIYGCKKLKREMDKHNGDVRAALLGYNGGGDLSYPDRVLQLYPKYQKGLNR